MQLVVDAFLDGVPLLQAAVHDDVPGAQVAAYEKFLEKAVAEAIVVPLTRDLENELRVRIHAKNLTHSEATPTLARRLRPFLDMPPVRLLTFHVDVKGRVGHKLENTFYDLTTVALHDFMTYADMRQLCEETCVAAPLLLLLLLLLLRTLRPRATTAVPTPTPYYCPSSLLLPPPHSPRLSLRYGLHLTDNHLPMGSLDQGLDVLRIMQNIHVFVARFSCVERGPAAPAHPSLTHLPPPPSPLGTTSTSRTLWRSAPTAARRTCAPSTFRASPRRCGSTALGS